MERVQVARTCPPALTASEIEAVVRSAFQQRPGAPASVPRQREGVSRSWFIPKILLEPPGPCLVSPGTCRLEAVPEARRFSHTQPSLQTRISPEGPTHHHALPVFMCTHMCTYVYARCAHTHENRPPPMVHPRVRPALHKTHGSGRATAEGDPPWPRSWGCARQPSVLGGPAGWSPRSSRIRAVSYWNNLNLRRFSSLLCLPSPDLTVSSQPLVPRLRPRLSGPLAAATPATRGLPLPSRPGGVPGPPSRAAQRTCGFNTTTCP